MEHEHPFSESPHEATSLPAETPSAASKLTVAGLGASAGGIRALQRFFTALPANPGVVFVVVVHLAPDYESNLAQVLQGCTTMPVMQVRERVSMQPDHVYVIPPNQEIKITDGHLIVTPFEMLQGRRAPIDVFFRTLAAAHPDGISIVLSGGGTDGTLGIKAVKEHGGVVMVQTPEEAEVDAMPRSAIATGMVDFILPVEELAAQLLLLHQQHGLRTTLLAPPEAPLPTSEADILRNILQVLQARTGHDFSGYKPATVLRRLDRRMRVAQLPSLSAYLSYLRSHTHEAQALLKDLLISVTTFFRDPNAFAVLSEQVIPKLVEGKGPNEEVRVWIPGCATGEETYSLAMLLLEQLEPLELRPTLQLFASDLDEDALAYAREGKYPETIVVDISEARLQRFFVREGAYYRVKKELRDLILFAPHSVLKDPPFSRLDLISCRNLLIYLQRDLQEKVAALFHYALKPTGYLFLGSAESIDNLSNLFFPVDKIHRIYSRALLSPPSRLPLPDLPLTGTPSGRVVTFRTRVSSPQQAASDAELHYQALETQAPPSLLVDSEAMIVHVSATANRYLQFPSGSPTLNLFRAALPALRLELRTALYRVFERQEAAFSAPVAVEIQGQSRLVQIYVAPVSHERTPPVALVVFAEAPMTEGGTLPAEASTTEDVRVQLRQLEVELESTKTQLQVTIENAEAQQEEFRASNEELQSINEEYRSTLEELETSKEELQSINEELKTVNQELQERLREISQANNDFHNLIAATEVATLFIDRQLRIKLYTPPLTQLFNIMPVDQGRPLAHVTHRLQDHDILSDIQQVLSSLIPRERTVQRDDGAIYLMRLLPYRTSDDYIDGVVITFIDITARHRAESAREELTAQLALELIDLQRLQTISTLLIQEGNAEALYQQLLDAAIALMRADAGSLQLLDAERHELRLLLWKGFHPTSAAFWELVGVDSASSSWAAMRAGQRVIVPDIETCDFLVGSRDLEAYRLSALRAVQSTPLVSRSGHILGMISTHWNQPHQPGERELRLLDMLARQVADLVERVQAETALQQANAALEQRVAERTAALEQQARQLQHEMQERQRMQETLLHQERLSALGMLLANIAHELNNPLAVASMQIDNLAEDQDAAMFSDDLSLLRHAVERCQNVVRSFLALARQTPPTRRAVSLQTLFEDVFALIGHLLETDNITVEQQWDADLPPVWGDASQLQHVFMNLLSNAHYALRQNPTPRRLTLTALAEEHQVRLEVTDNGPGIPADVQQRLFEPFVTTKPPGEGSGLGLALSRRLVEAHDGTIAIQSQPGQGTTVVVTLPVAAAAADASPQTAPSPTLPPPPGTRVLLIDDEPGVQMALRRLLQRSGYELTVARNGREGLAALAGRSYEAILCDMRMPELDGPAFYRELTQRYPQMEERVIFLTGDVLSSESEAFLRQGHRPYLLKPFRAQDVRHLLQQVCAVP